MAEPDSFGCHDVAHTLSQREVFQSTNMIDFEFMWRVLAQVIENAARDPFSGDYTGNVIPLYG